MNKGQIIILSGPSGVGKSTIIKEILKQNPEMRFSVSVTTRAMRPTDVAGETYHFISREEYQGMVERDEFLEHAEYVEDCYGTPAKPIDEAVDLGYDILLDIDAKGAMQIKEKRPDAVSIFIAAPSFAELERRLRDRQDTPPEKIAKRLKTARWEYTMAPQYDYIVVSETDRAEQAAEEIMTIIKVAHWRACNRLECVKEEC